MLRSVPLSPCLNIGHLGGDELAVAMARLARLEIPGGWYYIINRGHQRRSIFRDRRCYEDFLKRLGQLPQRFGVRVHSYVLMPNLYHLQVEPGSQPALSAAMHWLNAGYGI